MSLSNFIMRGIHSLVHDHLSVLLVFFVVLFSARLFNSSLKRPPQPPGPWGLPILGFLPFILAGNKPLYCVFWELAGKYGPVFRVNMGSKPIVIVSNPDLIRKTLCRGEFVGKPQGFISQIIGDYGLMNSSGSRWKNERVNVHARLRALGVTTIGPVRERMEAKIMIETKSLLRNLASFNGKPIHTQNLLENSAANVVCSILMSGRFGLENESLNRLLILGQEGFQNYCKAELGSCIPFASLLPFFREAISKLQSNHLESLSILKNYVESRRKTFDPSFNEDMIDSFLYEEYMANESTKEQLKDIDMRLLQVLLDLFTSGAETISTSISWALLFLLHNPKVSQKLQNELDTVIGRNRLPSLNDRKSLPYIEATVSEVLRLANLNPLGTPHATIKDTMLGDYLIPEATTVFCSIYSCHMDPTLWKSPELFNPERFINSEGKYEASKNFMPFSVGRRVCLGEVLAKSELFLFISSIMHVFNLGAPHGELPTLKSVLTTLNKPIPYKVSFIPRDVTLLDTLDRRDSSTREI